ncbi:MAG: NnrS family protein [Burkholderiaceae bacterium]|nr:NnrS family protein [Burkholderiaceae bacterium]
MRIDLRASFRAPLWCSAFRPFYLLGLVYAVLVMVVAAIGYLGVFPGAFAHPLRWWHGHEMVFGFATAMVVGTLLTALPSWAATPEIRDVRLALLAALWLAGRVAIALAPVLPAWAVALADLALVVVLATMLVPQVLALEDRRYRLLFLVLAGLFVGNILFHVGLLAPQSDLSEHGLRIAIDAIALIFVLKSGVLTPAFTENALRERGSAASVAAPAQLHVLAVASVLATGVLDAIAAPAPWVSAAALVAFASNALRLACWRGLLVVRVPLVFVMHLAYAWFVASYGLRALSAFSPAIAQDAWLHAFTIGAVGLMSIGLMVRVVLRHTGRPLHVAPIALCAWAAMLCAAVFRVGAGWTDTPVRWATGSAIAWSVAFGLCLIGFGSMLWRPSLPRASVGGGGPGEGG